MLAVALLITGATQPRDHNSIVDQLGTVVAGLLNQGRLPAKVRQPIRVIGAGFGRTGTTSLLSAFHRLGLNAYHMREGVIEGGHGPLWTKWQKTSGNMGAKRDAAAAIIEAMAIDGYNATTDFPACLLYPELMDVYPAALVVLGVRSSGAAWAKSMLGSIARFMPILKLPPWSFVPQIADFRSLNEHIFSTIGAPIDAATGYPRHVELSAAHDVWIAEVRRAVPAERLLVHEAKDGWKPLCDFLSSGHASVAAACDDVMRSGEPYPHVNDTAAMQRIQIFMKLVSTLVCCSPLLILLCYMRRWRNLRRAVAWREASSPLRRHQPARQQQQQRRQQPQPQATAKVGKDE